MPVAVFDHWFRSRASARLAQQKTANQLVVPGGLARAGLSLEPQRQGRVEVHRRPGRGLTRLEAAGPQLVAVRPAVPLVLHQVATRPHLGSVRLVVPLGTWSCGSIQARSRSATDSILLAGVGATCSIGSCGVSETKMRMKMDRELVH